MKKKMFLGIVGLNGSGKSTVCHILEDVGFSAFSLSAIVRDYVAGLGLTQDRETLIHHANDLKTKNGLTYFAEKCFNDAVSKDCHYVVFDSVRHPLEVKYLKSKGVYFIHLDVPIELRFQRIKERQADTDQVDFETFKQLENLEIQGNSMGQSLKEAIELCDSTLLNSGDTYQLRQDLLHTIKQAGFDHV